MRPVRVFIFPRYSDALADATGTAWLSAGELRQLTAGGAAGSSWNCYGDVAQMDRAVAS